MLQKKRILYIITIAIILLITTSIIPIYFSVPRYISQSISANALVSMSLGPIFGSIFAIISSYILNNVGMGGGVILYVLLTKVAECILIGLINLKKNLTLLRVVFISLALTVLIRPISLCLYYLLNIYSFENTTIIYYLKNQLNYLVKEELPMVFTTYLVSCLIAYLIIKLLKFNKIQNDKEKTV